MIKLTHPERRLRDLLVSAAAAWPRKPEQTESLIVRFAGGWVRDKLLLHENADIDVAVNIATGVQFASHVESYLKSNPLQPAERFHYNTINRNVEQSKHLETATAHFMGLDLDFVNLRSEEYAEHSRIPETMRFGTPKEDAERRDLTINSLFYNLHTESVEDFTGKGVDDIENGIIRTPLDPMTTFLDDPLRVLRAVRFAARLDFKITPEVKAAMMAKPVKDRLRNNVTIPRKADEIKKLLKSPNPLRSLELVDECCLYNHTFTLSKRDPSTDPTLKKKSFSIKGVQDPPRSPAESVAAGRLVTYLLQHRIAEFIQLNGNSTLPWLLAGLAPWRGVKHDDPPKREPKFLSSLITKHELMYGEDVRNVVEDIFETGKMSKLYVVASANARQQLKRHEAVVLVRELGENWRMITFTALLYELVPNIMTSAKANFDSILARYVNLVEILRFHQVENAYAVKRLVPGNELASLLGGLPSTEITINQEKAIVYQIVHNISDPEKMKEEITSGKFKTYYDTM